MLSRIVKKIKQVLGVYAPRRYTELKLGVGASVDPRVEINAGSIHLGDYSYIGGPGRISGLAGSSICFGKFCSVGQGVQFIGALHKSHITNYSLTRIMPKSSKPKISHGTTKGDIAIGNDVWIGANAIVLSGVQIGDGAIVAAGAVVSKNVEPYAVVAGVPAKKIKQRFSDEEIEQLLEIRWWDWSYEKIIDNATIFFDDNVSVSEFVDQVSDV